MSACLPLWVTRSLWHSTFIIAPPGAVFFFLSEILLQTSTPTQSLVIWKHRIPPRSGNSPIIQPRVCRGSFSQRCHDTPDMNHLRKEEGFTLGHILWDSHQVSEGMRQLTGHIASQSGSRGMVAGDQLLFLLSFSKSLAYKMLLSIFRVSLPTG